MYVVDLLRESQGVYRGQSSNILRGFIVKVRVDESISNFCTGYEQPEKSEESRIYHLVTNSASKHMMSQLHRVVSD